MGGVLRAVWLGVAAALAAGQAQAAPLRASEPPGAAQWFVIMSEDGQPIGHASEEVIVRPDGREIVGRQEVRLREGGGPVSRVLGRSAQRQDAAGRTTSISDESRIGASWSRTEARIVDGRADIVRTTPGDRRTASVALTPGVRFDGGDGLLADWDPTRSPRLEFDSFDIDDMAVERVVITAAPRTADDPPGVISAVRTRYVGGELRGVSRLRIDAGRIVAVTQPMFGSSIAIRAADRAAALKPHPPYSVLPRVMAKSPYRISPGALQGRIRYRYDFKDGFSFSVPQTGEQRVTAGPDGLTLDICEACGPGLPSDPATLADAGRPTVWLQSDDRRIIAIAAPIAKMRVTEGRKMELLAERARPLLGRVDFAGHFSAVETLQRRAGDCSEAAVLLAALGRAAGIPTRVANGLVYSRQSYHGVSNAFMPHSWTLAYVEGKWRSFDAALLGFDATHIALTVGDGDARSVLTASQLASLLQLEEMSEVRSRSAR